MRGINGLKFFSIVLVIGILTFITVQGFDVPGTNYRLKDATEMRFGIDIKGGVRVTLSAPEGVKATENQMDAVRQVMEKRLDARGIFDRDIITEKASSRVIIQIPWKAGEKNFDPEAQIKELGKTALLTFQEVDETKKDPVGNYLPTGKIIIQGTDVLNASPEINQQTGGYYVSLKLNDAAGRKFEEATGRLVGKPIAIFMDDILVSAPNVNEKIPAGNGATITMGSGNTEEAQKEAEELASTIRSGALPFKLETLEVNSISPLLGENALNVSALSGVVALILVCLFMLFYYRLPGIMANIALIGHTAIQLVVLTQSEISVTLPGIAGIILTIGMGVDANVIIFERIKEELRNGKTLRAAIDVGFKRAFSAILDANITTLISAGVLIYFGTGPIKSFGYTLGLGVLLSFFTAVTASRIMLRAVAGINIAKHPWLYGVKGGQKNG